MTTKRTSVNRKIQAEEEGKAEVMMREFLDLISMCVQYGEAFDIDMKEKMIEVFGENLKKVS